MLLAHPELNKFLILQFSVPVDVIVVNQHLDLRLGEVETLHSSFSLFQADHSVVVHVELVKHRLYFGNPATRETQSFINYKHVIISARPIMTPEPMFYPC